MSKNSLKLLCAAALLGGFLPTAQADIYNDGAIDWERVVTCTHGRVDVRVDVMNHRHLRVSVNDGQATDYLMDGTSILRRVGDSTEVSFGRGIANDPVHNSKSFFGFLGTKQKNNGSSEELRVFRQNGGLRLEIYSGGHRYCRKFDGGTGPLPCVPGLSAEEISSPSLVRDWFFPGCN